MDCCGPEKRLAEPREKLIFKKREISPRDVQGITLEAVGGGVCTQVVRSYRPVYYLFDEHSPQYSGVPSWKLQKYPRLERLVEGPPKWVGRGGAGASSGVRSPWNSQLPGIAKDNSDNS